MVRFMGKGSERQRKLTCKTKKHDDVKPGNTCRNQNNWLIKIIIISIII